MDFSEQSISRLLKAIICLQNKSEVAAFLRDLLTEAEIIEISKRLTAADMLNQGKSYLAVQEATGLSSTTIARVSRWLQGPDAGYKLVLERLHRR